LIAEEDSHDPRAQREGVTVLLVEQNACMRCAWPIAAVLETACLPRGPAAELMQDQRVKSAYLGE
jgi:ABC-type branched-subunit amino acid transport system ATPase component